MGRRALCPLWPNIQHPNIKGFFLVIWNDWGARMSGIFTVPFTIAALFAPSEYRAIFAVMAILAFAITAYRVWADERRLLIGLEQHLAPRLRFEFDPQDDRFVCETSMFDYTEIVYIRVLARPLSPVVKNCRGFLKSVSQLADSGEKYDSVFEDPIPLPWSYENPNQVLPKELNQSVDSFLDVAWVVEGDFGLLNRRSNIPNQLRDVMQFLVLPKPSRNIKLDLLLIGDDSEAATLSLNIHRGDPQWKSPEVGWMTDPTGNAIHNRRSNVSTDLTPSANVV
jgi:hypothetical protein